MTVRNSNTHLSDRTVGCRKLTIHKDGYCQTVDKKAVFNLEWFDLPYETELSYDWKDANGERHTLVIEPGGKYVAKSSLMFIGRR